MKIDVRIEGRLSSAGDDAQAIEEAGFDGAWVAEAGNDPFLPLVPAIERTAHLDVGTGVAIALARSPMTLAQTAWDLNAHARGRFLLGLGSQVKAHIERRYSMPWSHPAARMRELVMAMRAIWDSWATGSPLDFRGDFYTHTLMPPMFAPPPSDAEAPRVLLAGVGPRMTRVAGEVADGLRVHGFTTERYLREVTWPAVREGLAAAGRDPSEFTMSYPVMFVTGLDEAHMAAARQGTKKQLAFYGSTPAYLPVLELHGWAAAHHELNVLARQGRWDDMADVFDDDMLATFAVVGEPTSIAAQILQRYGDLIDRVSLHHPYGAPEGVDLVTPVMRALRAAA